MSFHSSTESLNFTNSVWDDGEWVSWAEINRYVEAEAAEGDEGDWDVLEEDEEWLESDEPPKGEPSPEFWRRLMNLIWEAKASLEKGNNIGSQIGEIGEMYAEAMFGIKRHRPYTPGSDGKLGNDFVEVKTISPWKKKPKVRVKRAGNWNRLVIVKISKGWVFDARIFDRKQLGKGKGGTHATVSWRSEKAG